MQTLLMRTQPVGQKQDHWSKSGDRKPEVLCIPSCKMSEKPVIDQSCETIESHSSQQSRAETNGPVVKIVDGQGITPNIGLRLKP